MKRLVICLIFLFSGCSTRTEYIYLTPEKHTAPIRAMIEKYCKTNGEVPQKLLSDHWLLSDSESNGPVAINLFRSYRVAYCSAISESDDVKLMVILSGVSTWPGLNFPLIAMVHGDTIVSSYYETSSDAFGKIIYDHDENNARIYLDRRSGGYREVNLLINKSEIVFRDSKIYQTRN